MFFATHRSFKEKYRIFGKKTKRDRFEIFAAILELCKTPTLRTHIIYKTALSYNVTMNSLGYLIKLQMLRLGKNRKKYETTEKGLDYLNKYYELQEFLKS